MKNRDKDGLIRKPILVAGLGNLLLKDDGVGVHAVRELAKDPPEGALAAEIGTALLSALHLLEEADAIVAIDAMQGGRPPGTIYTAGFDNLDTPPAQPSLHQLGLAGTLRMLPGDVRRKVVVVGVEPESIEYGMELSPTLQSALPEVLKVCRSLCAQLLERNHN